MIAQTFLESRVATRPDAGLFTLSWRLARQEEEQRRRTKVGFRTDWTGQVEMESLAPYSCLESTLAAQC